MASLQTYLTHRNKWEFSFWMIFFLMHWVANSITTNMDRGSEVQFWEPFIWEGSSGLGFALVLPLIIWFDQKYPLSFGTLKRNFALHFVFSVPISILHVLIMVGIREVAYYIQGGNYDFGHWPTELVYEYLKDFRSYFTLLAIVYLYRFIILRMQGEVALLSNEVDEIAISNKFSQSEAESKSPSDLILDRILIKKLGKEFLVNAQEIEWLEASGNYVNLHVKGRIYPYRGTMKGLESKLSRETFLRVHRSYIVNLNHIQEIEPLDSGDATILLSEGKAIPFSRKYRANLRQSI